MLKFLFRLKNEGGNWGFISFRAFQYTSFATIVQTIMPNAKLSSLLKCDKCFLSSSLDCIVERQMKTEEQILY